MAWFVVGDTCPTSGLRRNGTRSTAFRGRGLGAPPSPGPPLAPATPHPGLALSRVRFADGSRVETTGSPEASSRSSGRSSAPSTRELHGRDLERVKEAFPDDPPGRWRTTTGNLHRFLTGIKRRRPRRYDARLLGLRRASDGRLRVGALTSHPWIARRRSVEWLNADAPASRDELSPTLLGALKVPLAVSRIPMSTRSPLSSVSLAKPELPQLSLARVTPRPRDRLFFDTEPLQEMVDLLAQKRQLVFFGPPGTGKTLVAQALAEHLTANGGDWQLAQFHPSYSYEDFMEGYRPTRLDRRGGELRAPRRARSGESRTMRRTIPATRTSSSSTRSIAGTSRRSSASFSSSSSIATGRSRSSTRKSRSAFLPTSSSSER